MENINEQGHSFTKEDILRFLYEQPINYNYTMIAVTNIVDTLFPGTPFVEHTDEDGHVYYYSDDCDLEYKYKQELLGDCLFKLRNSYQILNSKNGLLSFEELNATKQAQKTAYNRLKEFVNELWPEIVKEPRRAKKSPFLMIEGLPTIRGTQRESNAFNNAIKKKYMILNKEGNGYVWKGVSDRGKIAQFAYFVHKLYYSPTIQMPDSNTILGLINVPFKSKNPQNAYNQALNRYMETDWENNPPKWKGAIDLIQI